jgi:hypothetical protein
MATSHNFYFFVAFPLFSPGHRPIVVPTSLRAHDPLRIEALRSSDVFVAIKGKPAWGEARRGWVQKSWRLLNATAGDNREDGATSSQFRLNRFLPSCIEMKSVIDNLASGAVVAELPLATAGVIANGGWCIRNLGPGRFVIFRFF